jgi:hypothetical protein
MIPISKAADIIGVNSSRIYASAKYRDYIINASPKQFDIERYQTDVRLEEATALESYDFIFYLKHICKITYRDIVKGIVSSASITYMRISKKTIAKIMDKNKERYPKCYQAFLDNPFGD